MQFYHFERLIKKYSTPLKVIIPKGSGVDEYGDVVKNGTKTRQIRGAVVSHRENKVFKSGGTITQQDKALYLLNPLENDLQGAEIVYGGNLYRIGDKLENALFTGVYAYGLKYVSAFNEVAE